MQELTRRGICYNLEKSPYTTTLAYGDKLIIFYFSSTRYKEKFDSELDAARDTLHESLSNRFKIDICFSFLSDLILYRRIEKRGFHVFYDGEVYDQWPTSLNVHNALLNGVKKMK